MTVIIRPERPADERAIHAVHAACFPTAEEADVVDDLRYSGHLVVSLVAVVDGEVVGHVACSPVTTHAGDVGLGVAPVAVLEAHRRQGIADRLIRSAFQSARQGGYGWMVVLGDPLYYRRFGFQPAPPLGLWDVYGGGNAFQILELIPGTLPRDAGPITYGPSFQLMGAVPHDPMPSPPEAMRDCICSR